ncbi:alpha/beta hydrolase [Microlunatus elymi]|uniref:Alpha/beta hydrolase n=1 Tax=Microlunatus elymi TaxID=2596828 RepID=A0A516PY95_9ACTN|nr:alpha/beta hydrolase [Microlunatus elymi]QDP96144.1 alpha/beta hydrolase [Microlunatus elymi]
MITSKDHGTVSVRGAELAYTNIGSGPAVIVAHGLTSSRASNQKSGLLDMSAVAEAGYTVISYDARGHGESTGTPDPDDYLWTALADDLLGFADAVVGDDHFSLIGSSMGTATGIFAALKQPDRIAALVLTAPPTAWQTRAAQAELYRTMADAVERNDQEAVAELLESSAQPEIFAALGAEPLTPDITPELMPAILRGAAATDLPPLSQIATIGQQTLLLPWATDPGHPVSTATALAEAMINSRLRIAHTAEQVQQYGDWSAAFLREVVG